MMETENKLFPEKAALFGTISLSASSVLWRTWIMLQIRQQARNLFFLIGKILLHKNS